MSAPAPRLAYLFARYPVPSQTFCDSEVLALESLGAHVEVFAASAPRTTFRHERLARLRAPTHYLASGRFLRCHELRAERNGSWPAEDVAAFAERFAARADARTLARQATALAPRLRERGIQHVHAHFAGHAALLARFTGRLTGLPWSFTAHAQDFLIDLGDDDLLRELCREAAFVVAVSDWSRDRIRETCPESAEKIVRVYNGLDPAEHPVAAEHAAPSDPRIVSIGRLIEFKGHHHLIAACAELARREVPFRLDLIGDGPWEGALREQVQAAGLESRVELTGLLSQDAVKRVLRESDVFALGSIVDEAGACDVLPTVILEAMAAGLPVVSTDLVGIPEMVDDGAQGRLAPPGDAHALADALESLLRDAGARERMGNAARERFLERFDSARTVPALLERFEAAAAPSVSRAPEPGWAVLVDSWPPRRMERLDRELETLRAVRPAVPLLVGDVHAAFEPTARGVDLELACGLEPLPDGIVLEALWQAHADWREHLDALRVRVPGFFSGESYYTQARRAVWVADQALRRGFRHLHAPRSTTILWAWLVKQLVPVSVSFVLDRRSSPSRRAHARLCRDLDFGAASDDLVVTTLRSEGDGADPLVVPTPTPGPWPTLPPLRPLRGWLQPLRGPGIERGVSYAGWLERLDRAGRGELP